MLMAADFLLCMFLLCSTHRCLDRMTRKRVLARLAQYKATSAPLLQHYAEQGVLNTIANTASGSLYSNVRAHFAAQLPLVSAARARSSNGSVDRAATNTADDRVTDACNLAGDITDLLRASRDSRTARQQQEQLAEQPLNQETSESVGGESAYTEFP
jgi:hypothetical protein